MLISRIPNERLGKTEEANLTLRDGQVALGKVNKIYPNNRAEVQIGSHRFIAQIETPLAVGERYIFQVNQKSDDLIQLRVISSQINGLKYDNIVSLLSKLQVRVNDVSISFVQSLIDERIPFSRKQLVDALTLMNQVGSATKVQSFIKQMIVDELPLQESILRSLLSYSNNSFSQIASKAFNEVSNLQKSQSILKLQSLLHHLLHSPTAEQMSTLPQEQLRPLVQSLQLFHFIFPHEQNEFERHINRLFQRGTVRTDVMTLLLNDLQQNIQRDSVRTSVIQLIQQYKPLHQLANELLREFNVSNSSNLTEEQFALMKNRILNHLLPLLHENEQQVINKLLHSNNSYNINQLHAILQTFATNHFYSTLMESIASSNDTSHHQFTQQRFLLHMKQIVQTLGLANESIIKNEHTKQGSMPLSFINVQETIKALLLHVLQDERTPLDNIQQLVHYINGLQLQTKEESNIIQAHLQIPGKKIGLPEDLFVQLEGRKTEDDQIDPEFCRILFFLNLNFIKETIIDMNIQKRVITLTVYNELNDQLAKKIEPLKQRLANGLEQLNYRLSNIRFKPIEDNRSFIEKRTVERSVSSTKREGFDIRI